MEVEFYNFVKTSSKSRKMAEKITVKLNLDTIIKNLEQDELCKYLNEWGLWQSTCQHKENEIIEE